LAGGTFWEIVQMIEHSPGFGPFTPFACAPRDPAAADSVSEAVAGAMPEKILLGAKDFAQVVRTPCR